MPSSRPAGWTGPTRSAPGATTTRRSGTRYTWLNDRRFAALHYTGPGTDLSIGLADGHQWYGGASMAKNGITCNPNIPTEEVFTTPHAQRVSGRGGAAPSPWRTRGR